MDKILRSVSLPNAKIHCFEHKPVIRYFEIEFDNVPRNQEGWEGDTIGDYSICILGEREPTIQEATEFCKEDMKQMGYKYVVNVLEIDQEEARTFFDMEREKEFPVFR